jgi:hypothetical protein
MTQPSAAAPLRRCAGVSHLRLVHYSVQGNHVHLLE